MTPAAAAVLWMPPAIVLAFGIHTALFVGRSRLTNAPTRRRNARLGAALVAMASLALAIVVQSRTGPMPNFPDPDYRDGWLIVVFAPAHFGLLAAVLACRALAIPPAERPDLAAGMLSFWLTVVFAIGGCYGALFGLPLLFG
jgi:hypothetical protein